VIEYISLARVVAILGFSLAVLNAGISQAQVPARQAAAPAAAKPAGPVPAPAPAPAKPAAATAAVAAPPTVRGGREPDLAYGAYQRGYFLTAFYEATKRVEQKNDVRAMTLLGEIYSCVYCGVPIDEAKAAKWYKIAADRGDPDAMFALAIFHITRRGGLSDRNEAAKLLTSAAKLGHPTAAYDLGLLYLEGQQLPQDFGRADLFKLSANAGNPEAQYALATLYKDGKGVPLNLAEAARWLAAAALAENIDAEVEYAIALFNGTGVTKDQAQAARLFRKASLRGSPIAQNRLARLLTVGQGMPMNATEAIKWHLIAKAGGNGDPYLDQFMAKQPPQVSAAAEKAAQPWVKSLEPR
jgi:uncharacterized protein